MEIRQLTGMEQQEARYIWSQSFERGNRAMEDWIEWEERVPSGRTTYGIFDSAGLQAAFLLVDEVIHLGPERTVSMGAVCGVGVLPARRGLGYASTGVAYLFERMRDKGQSISFLEPFSWEFYGRLGYAWSAPTRRYEAPTRVMSSSPETAHVRAARKEDRAAIVACYERQAHRYRGMVARRPEVWDWLLDVSKKEYTYAYLYEREGEVEGYLYYHGGKRAQTRLDEFTALTPRAMRGMIGLLRRHEMQVEIFRWDAPSDDPFWSLLTHAEIKTSLCTKLMARIVDVAGALQEITPRSELSGAASVLIKDETAPWNQGTWRIEYEAEHVRLTPTHRSPDVTIDIQALTQAYLGGPTLADLRAVGRIDVDDERGFIALSQLLAGPPAWCNDGF